MNKSSISNKFKRLYWLIALITIGVIIFFAVGIAIFYVTAINIYQSIENTNQSIQNIYNILTIEASMQDHTIELTASAPTPLRETIAPEFSITPSQTATSPQPNETQNNLSISLTQTPRYQSCDCKKIFSCSDFSSPDEAQNCFLNCGGSTLNNWSGLDDDHNGYACNDSTTYP